MSQKNQILDVSYGTFSCRLEGFEDSVATMKTVVSYFHDLAGHNRFMDMAPQAPDMDTLAQLTEEQAGTEVEIEGTGQNVSLRAAFAEPVATAHDDVADDGWDDEDDDDPISLTADDDEEDESEYADAGVTNITQDDYEEDYDDDFEEDVEPVAAEADIDDFEEDDSIAAKLQRIRAVVGRGHVSATPASTPAVSSILDLDEDDDDEDDKPNPLALRLAELAKRNAEVTADAEQDTVADEDDPFDEDMDEFADDMTDDETTDQPDTVEDDEDDSPLVLSATPHDPTDAFEFDADEEEDLGDDIQHSKRDDLTQNVDSAMSRILSETDAQLNTPEGRRHRGAFAQLKAAVAATEAARQMGDKDPTVDKDEAFREDLSAHDAEERSEARDSAPLRLVQPLPAASDSKPLDHAAERLRRIASMKEQSHGPATGGFAEFAAEQGVTELGDLLEAAAAYIAFVEGDEDFSRPQVMKKVQMASSEEISREDGLRSFGRLLRQSKILKLDNGRFQVAENTRFRPDQTA